MKTRNKLLLFVSVLVVIYTVIDIVLAFVSMQDGTAAQLDSTLTEQIFSFAKWVVTTGAAITVAKTVKGNTNSDETEGVFEDVEEEIPDEEQID